jgi:phage gp29-like protein
MSKLSQLTDKIKLTTSNVIKAIKGEQGIVSNWYLSGSPRPIVQDDVVQKKGSADYDLMRHDPDVKAALLIKTAGVLSQGWEISAGVEKEDPLYAKATEQKDFIEAVFSDMNGSLDDILEDMLYDSLLWGISLTEKIWALDKDSGFITLAQMKPKDPRLYEFEQDDFGNVTHLYVTSKGGRTEVDIPKFIRMSYNNVHDEPWGTSDLRGAYLYWQVKRNLVKWWSAYLERFADPLLHGTYPSGTSQADIDKLFKALQSLQQETVMTHGEGTIVELLESSGKTTTDFNTALDYYGKQIVKAILGQTLATEQGSKAGSYAQAKVHKDTLETYIRKLKRSLEETMNEQVIRDLIDLNFADRVYPNFALSLNDTDVVQLSQAIYQMITAGEVIPGEEWIRPALGWPERPQEETITQSAPVDQMTKPAPRTSKTDIPDNAPNSKIDNAKAN